jgi:hypothetical protein
MHFEFAKRFLLLERLTTPSARVILGRYLSRNGSNDEVVCWDVTVNDGWMGIDVSDNFYVIPKLRFCNLMSEKL